MEISFRRPTLDEMNRGYTAIMIGWGAVLGSTISFLLSGAELLAIVRLYQRKIIFPSDRDVLWIGAAFALFFLAEALAGAVHYSGSVTLLEMVENLPFLGFLLPYARLSLSSRKDVLDSVDIGVISGAFATLAYALFQAVVLNYPRVEGLAGNPGPFALVAAILYGLALLAAVRQHGRMRIVAVLAAIAAAIALILSGMRALWPVLMVAPAILFILFRPGLRSAVSIRLALAAAASIVVIGFLTADIVETRLEKIAEDYQDIVEDQDYANSLGYRLRLWRAGLGLAAERPILGHGPGNETILAMERTAEDGMPPIGFSHFHNFLLTTMVRSGLVGVAALLFMFAAPVWLAARKARDDIATVGLAMMLMIETVYLLSGSVGIMLGHDILDALFIYGMIVASFLVFDGRQPVARETPAAPGMSAETVP